MPVFGLIKTKFSDYEKELIQKDLIAHKKQMSDFLAEAKKRAKGTYCYYCGKTCAGFCVSHYVPKFSLKNIAYNGELLYFNNFWGVDLLAPEKGVKQAGTFNIICRECDSKTFQDYENPNNYTSDITQKMMAEIAMKDYLKFIYKRKLESAMGSIVSEKNPIAAIFAEATSEAQKMDLAEYDENFNKAKLYESQLCGDKYEVLFHARLPYVVPIAMQSCVALISDLQKQCVNNTYSFSPEYQMQYLHISVLPLTDSTVILMFFDEASNRYNAFKRQFRSLPLNEQLGVINYMIFLYTEDYFLSPTIPKEVLENTKIKDAVNQSPNGFGFALSRECAAKRALRKAVVAFDLNKWPQIPNLFDEKYKVR